MQQVKPLYAECIPACFTKAHVTLLNKKALELLLWLRQKETKTIIHSIWLQEINFLSRRTEPTAGTLSLCDKPKAALSLSNAVTFAKVCQLAQLLTFTKWQLCTCSFCGTFFYHGLSRAAKGVLFKYHLNHFPTPDGMLSF